MTTEAEQAAVKEALAAMKVQQTAEGTWNFVNEKWAHIAADNARIDLKAVGHTVTASAIIWRAGRFQRGSVRAPEHGAFHVMLF